MKNDDLNLSLSKKIFCNSNNVNTNNNINCRMTSKSSTSAANHNIRNGIDSNKAEKPKITADDYRFGRMIGEGSYSTVYLAKDIHTNKEFAIKVCDKEHIVKEKKQQYVKREREALHQLSSTRGFVNLICTFQDPKNLYFVTTFAKNGELLPNINKVGSFDLKCTKFYAAELLLSIEEMHKRRIIHRDLKPENILLDSEMHLMVADFGSSRILPERYDYDKESQIACERAAKEAAEKGANSDDEECHRKSNGRYERRASEKEGEYAGERKNSFVGTAQYVSPEVLKCGLPHLSTDLWALGCIIYQMISGLPPFRGPTEFLIFQKVLKCEYEFPEGFDEHAKDLVKKLIRFDPLQRLGSSDDDSCRYKSIRNHPFFDDITWEDLRSQKPPTINPYLPGNGHDEELRSDYHVNYDAIEPGLGSRQLKRLLEMELGTNISVKYPNILNLSDHEMKRKLEAQKESPWNDFVKHNELIFKYGFINKRKGLFSRRRMLLLTLEPRLIYIDPSTNIKKGEIPFCSALDCEPKNFKIFFVHTPNRTYYLEDPEGFALEWCKQINHIRDSAFNQLKLN